MDLAGKNAIVTGGASGIGASTVQMLKESGANVVSWDLNPEADVQCDVSDLASVEYALQQTIEKIGVPGIFVHAAGITARAGVLELDLQSWDHVMNVNSRGSYICLSLIAKSMVDAAVEDGAIVLVSSTASTLTEPNAVAYAGSKAIVNRLAQTAALELGPYGIRVNAILPGATATALTQRTMSSEEYRKNVVETTPMRRIGSPDLLADAIVNTLRMDWVTGQLITADGGSHLVTPRGALRSRTSGNWKAGDTSNFVGSGK